jgi:DNA-binding NarL/FixJ family response regulator
MSIRLLVVDDHELYRDLIAYRLSRQPGLEIAGSCGTIEEALPEIERCHPDIILLDYRLAGRRGTDLLAAARARGYKGKVLIVTACLGDRELRFCVRERVDGVVLKERSLATLEAAIQAVAEGRSWFDQRHLQVLLETPKEAGDAEFTPQERRILRCLVEGLSNKEIAARLSIPETTVKSAMQRLFVKTGVHSRGGLVRLAMEEETLALL